MGIKQKSKLIGNKGTVMDIANYVNLYQVHEYVGSSYSKQSGRRLRKYKDAKRVVRLLKKQGREVFTVKMLIVA